MHDIIIKNGRILDGSGKEAVKADVGIRNGRIETVGDLQAAEAKAVVDASGKYVCPGFIDAHSHSDAYLLIEPNAPSKIFQGVTTEITGHCGCSAAPVFGERRLPSDWESQTYLRGWKSVAEYRSVFEEVKPALNARMLIGQGAIRSSVVGYDNRPATADELQQMIKLLESSLDEGGGGLTTGFIYAPGMFTPEDEIDQLAKVVGRYGGMYGSHMRSEGDYIEEAVRETIGVGQRAGCRVQISHLKIVGEENWGKLDATLDIIREARAEGLPVAADRYPYTSGWTSLDVTLPQWAQEGTRDEILARLRDSDERKRMAEEMRNSRSENAWKQIMLTSVASPEHEPFKGQLITDIAKKLDMDSIDAILYLLDKDELQNGAVFFSMKEENLWKILSEPYVMLGSDASIRSPSGPLNYDHPHPRTYGSFTKFLRASINGDTVSLSEAVMKMTSLPAEQFQLKNRGLIADGYAADLVLFDPETVRDVSTYAEPHQLSEGIDTVIVNGVVTLRNRKYTGNRAGQFLALR